MGPGRNVQEEPALNQVMAITFVFHAGVHEIPKEPASAACVLVRKLDEALARSGAVVDGDQKPATRAFPRKRQEPLPGGIAFPGGPGLEQLPLTIPYLRPSHAGQ